MSKYVFPDLMFIQGNIRNYFNQKSVGYYDYTDFFQQNYSIKAYGFAQCLTKIWNFVLFTSKQPSTLNKTKR